MKSLLKKLLSGRVVLLLAGLLLGLLKILEQTLSFTKEIKEANSQPPDRKEKTGEVDSKGYKQVPIKPSKPKKNGPSGVEAKTTIELEAEGNVEKKPTPDSTEPSTGEVLEELDQY
jgi:hypothetical protein